MPARLGSAKDETLLSASASAPDLWPVSAAPGGPWVLRESAISLRGAGRSVAAPPKNEAAAIAWKASRKQTLQGQLGTGNTISSVVQYPVTSADPHNMTQRVKRHLTAEERRILRVRVKHHMKGRPSYPDCVYEVENMVLKAFMGSPELCQSFYRNDTFAERLLQQIAVSADLGRPITSLDMQPWPDFGSEKPQNPKFTRPHQHSEFCGPQCYCMRFQDAPLHAKTPLQESDWVDSFTQKTKTAAVSLVGSAVRGGGRGSAK